MSFATALERRNITTPKAEATAAAGIKKAAATGKLEFEEVDVEVVVCSCGLLFGSESVLELSLVLELSPVG